MEDQFRDMGGGGVNGFAAVLGVQYQRNELSRCIRAPGVGIPAAEKAEQQWLRGGGIERRLRGRGAQ